MAEVDTRVTVGNEEKLFDVARRYGPGYPELVRANPSADAQDVSRGSGAAQYLA
jgi:hypothetical protein